MLMGFVFAPVCTGMCCYFWWKQRTRVYGFREGGSWSPFFYYFVSPNPLIPTRPTYSTSEYPILPTHISSIAWFFIIISAWFLPDFIIFYLMLFILLRVQGFLLSLCGSCFFKTVSIFFGYHQAKEQCAIFFFVEIPVEKLSHISID